MILEIFILALRYGIKYILGSLGIILVRYRWPKPASHKSNPLSVPQGIVYSYSTLPWVTWEAVTFVEGITWWELLQHTLANGALVYPRQGGRYRAEGCMALGKRYSGVVNNPLGEPGRTPLYIGLPSAGAVDCDLTFFLYVCRRAPFWGLRQTYMNEWMNK